MSVNTRTIRATPEQVWGVLADGWTYPLWVVGASRIRDVDEGWPAVGTKIHHSVGVWPALIDDTTSVLEVEPQHRIRLRARGWPIGEAEVEIELRPSGAHTEVVIKEQAVAGPGVLVPEPLKGLSLKWRNTETLRRMAYICENRPIPQPLGSPDPTTDPSS
ncbi:MAG: polyketide cyclase [Aeromicrobium sp.]|nr:polyketide cyclase [Aeromicrobium sp.]